MLLAISREVAESLKSAIKKRHNVTALTALQLEGIIGQEIPEEQRRLIEAMLSIPDEMSWGNIPVIIHQFLRDIPHKYWYYTEKPVFDLFPPRFRFIRRILIEYDESRLAELLPDYKDKVVKEIV